MEEEKLEPHEFYILVLWGDGDSQQEIADKIFRSSKFVENVFKEIKRKLKTKNAQHSLTEAWKRKIITRKNCHPPTAEQLKECMMIAKEKNQNG